MSGVGSGDIAFANAAKPVVVPYSTPDPAPVPPPTDFDPKTEGNPRFGVLLITAGGAVYTITELETVETEKNDSGDAGTWSFAAPLAANAAVAAVISPMDIVAIYAYRAFVDIRGGTSPSAGLFPAPDALAGAAALGTAYGSTSVAAANFSYGAPDAATTRLLGTAECLMVGMVDSTDEDYDYESARMMINANGRDLTKVFIDNDTLVPATIADVTAAVGVASVVLRRDSSGTQLLEDILDVFVAKDPNRISELDQAQNTPLTTSELQTLTQYGYPWRNFVRTDRLIDGFLSLTSGQLPTYSVQSGSAWANVSELRNYPITRLFVNELGALIFDDQWTAWGFGSDAASLAQGPTLLLDDADVRHVSFRQSDDNVVTSLSIVSALMVGADVALAGLATFGKQRMSPTVVLSRFGYRYQQFVSQYDGIAAYITAAAGSTVASSGAAPGANATSTAIFNAAQAFKATHSAAGADRGLLGAPNGDECCAAVESVVALAGIPQIGTNPRYVPAFVAALPARGWAVVSAAEAVPGDFVILGDQGHVGIYEGNDLMVSNSSTPGSFTWESSPAEQQSHYPVGAPQFWHYQGAAPATAAPAAPVTPTATTTDQAANVLSARYPVLWQLHNNLWTATFNVKGDQKWRVGQRLATTRFGSQPATQPSANTGTTKLWYITDVKHSLSFGTDWLTTITARFPLDPIEAANVVGGGAAPL